MNRVDLSTKIQQTKTAERKEVKKSLSRFEHPKKEKTSLHEDLTEAVKHLLSEQKNVHPVLPPPPPLPSSSLPLSPTASWQPSSQIIQLFEKMTNLLTHVHTNGIQTTSIVLDGEAFASSVFAGAEITIVEYSTAPKVFNIRLAATPEALAFFAPHAQQLQTALKEGKWDFSIERLDTDLLERDKSDPKERYKRR
jgi:hypothetical protein